MRAILSQATVLLLAGAALAAAPPPHEGPEPELVSPAALRLSEAQAVRLGVTTAEVKPRARWVRPGDRLLLGGTLALAPGGVMRVRARVPGEVEKIGRAGEGERELRAGDRVTKGQVLAVVWSKNLAEKRGELLDALSQLALDQETLRRLEQASREGAIPERALREARRKVSADLVAANRAERTLRIWRLTDEEIDEVRKESARLKGGGKRDPKLEARWGRIEVVAPAAGVVVEKNVSVGMLVTDEALFALAALGKLAFHVDLSPEQSRAVRALEARSASGSLPWRAYRGADARGPALKIEGKVRLTRAEDSDVLRGIVANPGEELRPGEAVTLTLPEGEVPGRELTVPATALVEAGGTHFVFVQPNPTRLVYQRVPVTVVRRDRDTAHVRPATPEAPLRGGDRVVTAGALELLAALDDLTGP